MTSYIIQILFLQVLFLFFYELLFKKETFFKWNRAYLVTSSILAVILPFLRIKALADVMPQNYIYHLPEITLNANNELVKNSLISAKQSIHIPYLKIIYFIGFSLALLLFLKRFIQLIILIKKHKNIKENGYTLVLLEEEKNAFSFLNYIFIHKAYLDNKKLQIIKHELVHIKQKHTWDLLFFEFLKILFWFNPVIYIYQRRIAEVHEFLTDDLIIKQVDKRTYFNLLLNEVFLTKNIAFTNPFYKYSLIKKRIIMATKNKSKKVRLAKYLLLLPIIAITLIYTSCDTEVENPTETSDTQRKIILNLDDDSFTIIENGIEKNYTKEEVKGLKIGEDILKDFNQLYIRENKNDNIKSLTDYSKESTNKDYNGAKTVPFNATSKAPIFPDCKDVSSSKECFTAMISKHVKDNFNYPKQAKDEGLSGRVYVQFIIDTDGNVKNIKTRGPNQILEDEAKRIINLLPQFTPGKNNGKFVNVMFSLPITFKLAA
jgi:TonB family protein